MGMSRTFVIFSTSVVIPGPRTKQMWRSKLRSCWKLLRLHSGEFKCRAIIGLSCLTAVGNCETGYVPPRLRGSTHYCYFGCPFVTEAVNSIYGYNAAICLAPRGVVGFKSEFERAEIVLVKVRVRVSVNVSGTTRDCVHLYRG